MQVQGWEQEQGKEQGEEAEEGQMMRQQGVMAGIGGV